MERCPHCEADTVRTMLWGGSYRHVCTYCGCSKEDSTSTYDGKLPVESIFCRDIRGLR